MKVVIEINCDNFENFEHELSRILEKLSADIAQEYWHDGKELFDFNGNKAGEFKIVN